MERDPQKSVGYPESDSEHNGVFAIFNFHIAHNSDFIILYTQNSYNDRWSPLFIFAGSCLNVVINALSYLLQ